MALTANLWHAVCRCVCPCACESQRMDVGQSTGHSLPTSHPLSSLRAVCRPAAASGTCVWQGGVASRPAPAGRTGGSRCARAWQGGGPLTPTMRQIYRSRTCRMMSRAACCALEWFGSTNLWTLKCLVQLRRPPPLVTCLSRQAHLRWCTRRQVGVGWRRVGQAERHGCSVSFC